MQTMNIISSKVAIALLLIAPAHVLGQTSGNSFFSAFSRPLIAPGPSLYPTACNMLTKRGNNAVNHCASTLAGTLHDGALRFSAIPQHPQFHTLFPFMTIGAFLLAPIAYHAANHIYYDWQANEDYVYVVPEPSPEVRDLMHQMCTTGLSLLGLPLLYLFVTGSN